MSVPLSPQQYAAGIRTARGAIKTMPSSWIRDVDYDYISGTLKINMSGKWYGPWQVDPKTFQKFIMGKAVCVTSDPTNKNRWQRGDKPSLGAAYHRWIKVTGGPSSLRRLTARLTRFGRAARGRYMKP